MPVCLLHVSNSKQQRRECAGIIDRQGGQGSLGLDDDDDERSKQLQRRSPTPTSGQSGQVRGWGVDLADRYTPGGEVDDVDRPLASHSGGVVEAGGAAAERRLSGGEAAAAERRRSGGDGGAAVAYERPSPNQDLNLG